MNSYFFGERLINYFVAQRSKTGEESEVWKSYYRSIASMGKTSQSAMYICFEWPLRPKVSIESILRATHSSTPIEFYFGETDWMVSIGAERLCEEYPNIRVKSIKDAGHDLKLNDPEELCGNILEKSGK